MRMTQALVRRRQQANEPPGWFFVTLLALIWIYSAAKVLGSPELVNLSNVLGPLILGLSACISGYHLIRRIPEAIWTPYAWFLAAVVLFYCVGPLIYPFAGPRTLAYALSPFPIDKSQLLRANLLNAVGILTLLLGFRLAQRGPLSRTVAHAKAAPRPAASSTVVAVTFLAAGGALEFLVVLPAEFRLYHFVLPGVIKNLGDLYLLGLMVLAYVVAEGKRSWRLPLMVLWAAQVAVSVLTFSKHQLILSIVLPPLGAYLARGHVSRLVAWGLILGLVYFSVGQLVLYGRSVIATHTGNIAQASLSERAHIVRSWFQEGMPSARAQVAPEGIGWARLDYAPEQMFAMKRYDDGLPGQTLRSAGVVLIPRVIWPGKPITAELGTQFYRLVTGRRGTSLGLGIFGEGYWNYGWSGVVGIGLITGVVFSVLSSLSVGWIARRAFEYLPSIFLGINMGIVGTTQFFANSVVGATGFFFAYAIVAWGIVQVFSRRRFRSPSPPQHRPVPSADD